MTKTQKLFEQAAELVRMKPLPENVVQLLDEIREQVPAEAHPYFDDFYEMAVAARIVA
jgi:hypothetical protein